jgi:hypothetical protein
VTVELLSLPGCPHHDAAVDLVRDVLESAGLSAEFTQTLIADYAEAKRHGFPGSPTLRVNGRDIEDVPAGHLTVGFACRTYYIDGNRWARRPAPGWNAQFKRRAFLRRVTNEGHTGFRRTHAGSGRCKRFGNARLLSAVRHRRCCLLGSFS